MNCPHTLHVQYSQSLQRDRVKEKGRETWLLLRGSWRWVTWWNRGGWEIEKVGWGEKWDGLFNCNPSPLRSHRPVRSTDWTPSTLAYPQRDGWGDGQVEGQCCVVIQHLKHPRKRRTTLERFLSHTDNQHTAFETLSRRRFCRRNLPTQQSHFRTCKYWCTSRSLCHLLHLKNEKKRKEIL